MRIEASTPSLPSTHHTTQQRLVQERLRAWTGPRPDVEPIERGKTARTAPPALHDRVTISNAGRARIASESPDRETEFFESDPRLQLIISLVEMLSGRKVRFIRPEDRPLEYDRRVFHAETENSRLSAEGAIRTTDGQDIRFHLTLFMPLRDHEQHTDGLDPGHAVPLKDPLVINFAGSAAQLSDMCFAFDLNADGHTEHIQQQVAGSGILVVDLKANGILPGQVRASNVYLDADGKAGSAQQIDLTA